MLRLRPGALRSLVALLLALGGVAFATAGHNAGMAWALIVLALACLLAQPRGRGPRSGSARGSRTTSEGRRRHA